VVECFDRIHLRLAEAVLRPLQRLQAEPTLTRVTIRPPGRGAKVAITVDKTWPEGPDQAPVYRWSAREVDATGNALPIGRSWSDDRPHATADAAYWAAADAVAASRNRRARALIAGKPVSP
jgi:hypothetical protein